MFAVRHGRRRRATTLLLLLRMLGLQPAGSGSNLCRRVGWRRSCALLDTRWRYWGSCFCRGWPRYFSGKSNKCYLLCIDRIFSCGHSIYTQYVLLQIWVFSSHILFGLGVSELDRISISYSRHQRTATGIGLGGGERVLDEHESSGKLIDAYIFRIRTFNWMGNHFTGRRLLANRIGSTYGTLSYCVWYPNARGSWRRSVAGWLQPKKSKWCSMHFFQAKTMATAHIGSKTKK